MTVLLFSLIVLTIGTVLGLRFKVLVLAPVILFATIAIVISNHSLIGAVLSALGAATLLQLGYFMGCILGVLGNAQLPSPTTPRYRLPSSKTAH
jgi:small basic protein